MKTDGWHCPQIVTTSKWKEQTISGKFSFKMEHLLLVIFSFLVVASSEEIIRVVSPVYMSKIPGVVVYERTSHIVFNIPLPAFKDAANFSMNETADLMNLINLDIYNHLNIASEMGGSVREKRAIVPIAVGVGALLTSFGVSFGIVYSKTRDLESYVKQLKSTVDEIDEDLVAITTELDNYGGNLTSFVEHYQGKYERKLLEVLQLIQTKALRDTIVEAKQACSTQRIPPSLIPLNDLRTQLSILDGRLRAHNKTVAVPLASISHLYNAPVATCFFNSNSISVSVSVPVTRLGHLWSLYEIFPIKFAYGGQTCALHPNEPRVVAVSDSKIIEITPLMQARCQFQQDFLCLVPEYHNDASSTAKCAVGLLSQLPFDKLRKLCTFGCSNEDQLIVQQLTLNEYVVVNAQKFYVDCGNKQATYDFKRMGAVYIHNMCNCTVLIDGYYEIGFPMFCKTASNYSIHPITPSLWTKFVHLKSWDEKIYTSMAAIDMAWHDKIPRINLSQIKPPHVPEPPITFGLSFTELFLTVITIFLCVFGIIVIVLCVVCVKSNYT